MYFSKKVIALCLSIIVIAQFAMAEEILYTVRLHDNLINIIRHNFPNEKVHGADGLLKKIIALNPHIENPNLIFPKEVIRLRKGDDVEKVAEAQPAIPEPTLVLPNRQISQDEDSDALRLSVLMGPRYVSISQKGALGTADIGILALDNFKVTAEYVFEKWNAWFNIDSYKFKYKYLTAGKSMSTLELGFSYDWIMGSFGVQQTPLFRNNSGEIQFNRQNVMFAAVGVKKDITLPTHKPTVLKLKSWLDLPFSSSTDNPDVKLSSIRGFGLKAQAELNRQILKRNDYSLHFAWMNEIGFQSLSQNVKWDTSNGKVDSTRIDFSSSLGLSFKF